MAFVFLNVPENVLRLVQVATTGVSLFIVDGPHAPVSGYNRPVKDADIKVPVYINGRKLMEPAKNPFHF